MKLKSTRSLQLLCIIIIIISALASCKKSDSPPPAPPLPKIKTVTFQGSTNTYFYDDKGRLSKITDPAGRRSEYAYTDTAITISSYDASSVLSSTQKLSLNGDGLVVRATTTLRPGDYDSTGYNADKQRSYFFSRRGTYIYSIDYSYVNSNLDSTRHISISPAIDTTCFLYREYYTDKVSTIRNENFGEPWYGKDSRNPIKQYMRVDRQGTITISNWAYIFDDKNRIIQATYSEPSGVNSVTTYSYYD